RPRRAALSPPRPFRADPRRPPPAARDPQPPPPQAGLRARVGLLLPDRRPPPGQLRQLGLLPDFLTIGLLATGAAIAGRTDRQDGEESRPQGAAQPVYLPATPNGQLTRRGRLDDLELWKPVNGRGPRQRPVTVSSRSAGRS